DRSSISINLWITIHKSPLALQEALDTEGPASRRVLRSSATNRRGLSARQPKPARGDDVALILRGTRRDRRVDARQVLVGQLRLHRSARVIVVVDLAVEAEHAGAGQGDLLAHLRVEELGNGSLVVRDQATVLHRDDAEREVE